MNKTYLPLAIIFCFIIAAGAMADKIKLSDGREIQGVIQSQDENIVKIMMRGGTVSMPRESVVSIEKSAVKSQIAIPKWDEFMAPLATGKWADELHQIPATVIDTGVLKYVPYLSYQSGNYEINIYGDPENPACIEIGVRKDLLKSEQAKADCVKYISEIFRNEQFTKTLRSLKMTKDAKEIEGLTIEITPETDEDAFDGWWVSVYSGSKLDSARASEEELAKITEERIIDANDAADKAEMETKPEPKPVVKPEPKKEVKPVNPVVTVPRPQPWKPSEMKWARVPRHTRVVRVYVRSFGKSSAGKYVHAHPRKK